MKIKLFVAREIQYFELEIFSFNSYVYYLTRGSIASTRAFNLLTCVFSLPTRVFNLATRVFSVLTREFELVTRRFELVTCGFELVTRGFELVARRFELVTRGFELVTRNSCFTFPQSILEKILSRENITLSFVKKHCFTRSYFKRVKPALKRQEYETLFGHYILLHGMHTGIPGQLLICIYSVNGYTKSG